jgi:glycosyltransferase involved in cell wall biosynthesis
MKEFSVIVPAHNEAENLKILLPKIQKILNGLDYELIVVDNVSTDATRRVLEEFKLSIPRLSIALEPTLGYGRAVLAGLRIASGEYLGIIRSDNQEKPEDLLEMYRDCRRQKFHFYKAIRKSRLNDGLKRIIISRIYNFLFRVLFNIKTKDINAAPKIFSREFYQAANLESSDWFIDAEMVIKADRLGYEIGEKEIEYLPRLKGKSTVRLAHIFQFLKNMLIWHKRLHDGHFLGK